jgi:hypothetical protein
MVQGSACRDGGDTWPGWGAASAALVLAALPGTVWAATGAAAKDAGALAAVLGLGIGILLLVLVVGLLIEAVFIWMAAGLVGLPRSGLGVAFKAAFFTWILTIVFGFVSGFLAVALTPPGASALSLLGSVLCGTLAIKAAYEAGLLKAFLTYVVSGILTVIVMVGLLIALVVAFGAVAAH